MATRALATPSATLLLGTAISGQQSVDLAIDQRVFRTFAELSAQTIAGAGSTVKGVWVGGASAFGDLGRPILLLYSASPITAHDGYRTSNAGAVYWYVAPGQGIDSRFFGAAWNGSTDDYIANNKWAKFLRVTEDWGSMPPLTSYNSRTLYFGGVRFKGAGSVANTFWTAAKSLILTDGQPGVSAAPDASTAVLFSHEHWEGFCVKAAGGTLYNDADGGTTIDLWDYEDYPYQVLIWTGRSHLFMQKTTDPDPETASSSGDGTFTLRDFLVEDAAGWGIVTYKQYGNSRIELGYGRRCGGRAASVLGDDTLGGFILLSSATVDLALTDLHPINSSYTNESYNGPDYGGADYAGTATALRIGSAKSVTDGLDRYYESTNNIIVSKLHSEGYAIAEDWRACKYGEANSTNSNSGDIIHGWGANPSTDNRVIRTNTRITNCDLYVGQSPFVDLGRIINATPGTESTLYYWTGIAVELVAEGHATEPTYPSGITLAPQADITTQPGGSGLTNDYERLPHAITHSKPISHLNNLTPAFATSGAPTTLANWSRNSGGTLDAVTRYSVTISGGEEIYYDYTGLTAGELLTVELWGQGNGSVSLGSQAFAVRTTGGAAILTRTLGTGSEADGVYHKLFNVRVPTGETAIRLRLYSGSGNSLTWKTPFVLRGAAESNGAQIPVLWPARGELVATI